VQRVTDRLAYFIARIANDPGCFLILVHLPGNIKLADPTIDLLFREFPGLDLDLLERARGRSTIIAYALLLIRILLHVYIHLGWHRDATFINESSERARKKKR